MRSTSATAPNKIKSAGRTSPMTSECKLRTVAAKRFAFVSGYFSVASTADRARVCFRLFNGNARLQFSDDTEELRAAIQDFDGKNIRAE